MTNKLNLFLHHRDLRNNDNTTMIEQLKHEEYVTPIFIFTPEQIKPSKNEYFSNNSVQFMIESLHELSLYYFYGDTLKVLKKIHSEIGINSLGFNIDYTPYAKKRDNSIREFCKKENIKLYEKEDYVLVNILDGETLKDDGTNYQVYSPFKNKLKKLNVREVDKFKSFNFKKFSELEKIKYHISEKEIDEFYKPNPNINVHGGRSNGLKILDKIENFKSYGKNRDYFMYKTTFLGSHNHFSTVSIREVYHKAVHIDSIVNELIFRDFYYQLYYYNEHILAGQIGGKNKTFKEKYNHLKWNYNKTLFEKFCNGETGIPVCDSAIRQLNTTGFMHNRLRMVTASILTKLLMLPWQWGEKYFATKLEDYDPIQNSAGWNWTIGGIDPQQYTRIFSPKSQSEKFDTDCEFIKYWIPELKDVPNKDIHNWEEKYDDYIKNGIKYFKPIIKYSEARKKGIDELLRINKIKN